MNSFARMKVSSSTGKNLLKRWLNYLIDQRKVSLMIDGLELSLMIEESKIREEERKLILLVQKLKEIQEEIKDSNEAEKEHERSLANAKKLTPELIQESRFISQKKNRIPDLIQKSNAIEHQIVLHRERIHKRQTRVDKIREEKEDRKSTRLNSSHVAISY